MKKLGIVLLILTLFGCLKDDKKYACKNYDENPITQSLSIDGKKLTLGSQSFKYCENIGNIQIYHSNCKKNEYGNYESSIRFDPIIQKLSIIGSGVMVPVDLFQCSLRK